MPTVNYNIKPSDGWVQVASSPAYAHLTGFPHTHPYYVYAGSSAPGLTTTGATGTVTFATGVPLATETVLIGSETYTFVVARSAPFQVTIGVTNAATAANFKTAVNTDSTLVSATGGSNVITLHAIVFGSAGNYTISTAATNVSIGGVAMTGGTDIALGKLLCHRPLVINVTMTEKLYARVVSNPGSDSFRLDVLTV